MDKTDTMTTADERQVVERLWQEIRPLYQLVHAYLRQQMSKIYPESILPNQPIPLHLTRKWSNFFPFVQ